MQAFNQAWEYKTGHWKETSGIKISPHTLLPSPSSEWKWALFQSHKPKSAFHAYYCCCCSFTQSCPSLCDSKDSSRLPCSSPSPRACSNSCPLSQWRHPTISSSVVPFSCPLSFPASGSFPTSQLFESGGQSIGVSASTSVLPMNTQDWSPLGWAGWISLLSTVLSRASQV